MLGSSRAQTNQLQHKVLKLAVGADPARYLPRDHTAIIVAHAACPDNVVSVGEIFLINEVGVTAPMDHNLLVPCLRALHKAEIIHGDCRRENIISVRGKLLWIDLVNSYKITKMSSIQIENDFKILMESLNIPVTEIDLNNYVKSVGITDVQGGTTNAGL